MFSRTTGWAWSPYMCALKTTDGGAHWRDTTPGWIVEGGVVDCVHDFLDPKHAWIVLLDPDRSVTVSRTTDGGRSWAVGAAVQTHRGDGSARLDFTDGRNGWLEVLTAGNGALGADLFRTTDGGATWAKVTSTDSHAAGHLPFGGSIAFRDATTGWLAGGPRAAGGPDVRFWFYRTDDGGRTWVHQNLPVPDGIGAGRVWISAPVWFGPRQGVMAVTFAGPRGDTAYTYATEDGGTTWHPVARVPTMDGNPQFFSPQVGWAVSMTKTGADLYDTADGGTSWTEVPPDATLQEALRGRFLPAFGGLDFLDDGQGWALLQPRPSDGRSGGRQVLLTTRDGGGRWTAMQWTILDRKGGA